MGQPVQEGEDDEVGFAKKGRAFPFACGCNVAIACPICDALPMKALIPFLALMVLAAGAHAQGVVTFANHVLRPIPYVYFADGVTRLTGTEYGAQLYYGPSESSLAAHTAAPNRFRAAGATLAGTWSTTTGANRSLNGGGVGIPVWMQVRVWDVDEFPSYEAAVAGGGVVGTSSVFRYIQRITVLAASPTDTYMIGADGLPLFGSFEVVPEPGVGLLMIPAVVLLLFIRRAKNASRMRRKLVE